MSQRRFGGFISEAEHERFKRNFPQYGATQWFIETMVKRVNDFLDKTPAAIDLFDQEIKSMVDESMAERSDTVSSKNSTGTDGAEAR